MEDTILEKSSLKHDQKSWELNASQGIKMEDLSRYYNLQNNYFLKNSSLLISNPIILVAPPEKKKSRYPCSFKPIGILSGDS